MPLVPRRGPHVWLALLLLICFRSGIAAEPSISESWSRSIQQLEFDHLSAEIVDKLTLTLADCVGVMTFTGGLEEVRLYSRLTNSGGTPAATELVTGQMIPEDDAAAINALAIHGYEIDDSNLRNQLRASCVAVPAVLALAQQHDVDGQAFLTALAVSYHVSDRLATYMNLQPAGRLHRKGWMPSSVCGVVGAAAAGGKLVGLSNSELTSAIGLAAAGSHGLFQYYLEGTDEKKIHVARSQRMAVESVKLAQAGFRGAVRSIDGRAGLLAVLGYPVEAERLLCDFARFDSVLHVKPKFFGCSQGVIPWLETLQKINKKHPLAADQIEEITIRIDHPADSVYMRKINQFEPPTSVMAAQLSVNFGIGLFLSRNSAFVDDFVEDCLDDAAALSLAAKVHAIRDADQRGLVTVRLAGGETYSARYHPDTLIEPYTPVLADYREKFDRLTLKRLSSAQSEALWQHVLEVAKTKSMADWTRRLARLMGHDAES